jgi:hypothetical protein
MARTQSVEPAGRPPAGGSAIRFFLEQENLDRALLLKLMGLFSFSGGPTRVELLGEVRRAVSWCGSMALILFVLFGASVFRRTRFVKF